MEYDKIVLVTRKTRLEELIERFNTRGQAKFYIDHSVRDGAFAQYEREHEVYHAARSALNEQLIRAGEGVKVQAIERGFLPNFVFGQRDVVVVIGVDGLVVNASKYLDGQPVVAVNPDPAHIDGVLLPFDGVTAIDGVRAVLGGQFTAKAISMAEARLNNGQTQLAFNDLFIGARSHVSARYSVTFGGVAERHSSSGVIVSTGAGATGWLSSMFNMANGLAAQFGGRAIAPPSTAWDANQLWFVVREPFISKTSRAGIVCGQVTSNATLHIESEMAQGGVIFSDGIEADFLDFNAGTVATIGLSKRKTHLVCR